MGRAYVLLSGGVDSSTCLALAKDTYGEAVGIGIDYGQRHSKELQHGKQVADALGCGFIVKDLRGVISTGGLTDAGLVIPHVSYDELGEGVSPTYVPFRNGTLLAVAAGVASADEQGAAVYYGAHAEDAANWAYPDCTPQFFAAMAEAINVGTYFKIQMRAPLINLMKKEVIELGAKFNVPWELTWSCYEGGEIHCGTCPTCRSRRQAFIDAEIVDPTQYAEEM